jgi:hypothetical protein
MATGYIRNDTTNNIANGNIINAADLDGEFDAIQAAYDVTTGHDHDGTVGGGAPIKALGPAQDVVITTSVVRPKTDNTVDLGTSTLEFKDLYLDGTAKVDTLTVDENASVTGTLNVTGTTTLGTVNVTTIDTTNLEVTNLKAKDGTAAGSIADSTGVVTLASSVLTTADINGGTVDGAVIGGASAAAGTFTTATATTGNITTVNATTVDTTNIEVTNIKAKDGTASATIADTTGVMTVASLVATTADINGGTVDNATIATSDITVGAGKTLNVSAGTLTLADNQISGDKVEGGTINAITINTLGSTTGNITTVNATTVDTTNIEVTNIKAKDGTAAGSIADSTGVVTLASSVLTTTDINGGTIDGTTIGGSSAGAGTFTTATATTGNITTVNATTVDTTNIEVTTIKAKDGTSAGSIADSTGVVTLASSVLTTTDINGGTVDGAVIGGASAAAGTFTTVTASGDLTIPDKIVHSGDTNTAIRFPAADTVTIETSGTERMRITSAGNVGIGTTSPSNLLTVKSATTSASAWFQTTGASDQTITLGDPDTIANDCGVYGRTTGSFVFQNSGGAFVWKYASGTERMRIDTSGNVGIGTSSPTTALDVNGNVTITDKIIHSGDTNTAIRFPAADTVTVETDGAERLRVTSTGNVGIGTTTPAGLLEVFDVLTVPARNTTTIASKRGLSIYNNQSAGSVDTTLVYGNTAAAYLAIGNHNGTSYAERMRITPAGNVLIGGTATPASATASLAIFNGTAPTGSVTNGVVLYAEDVSSSSELKVRDEAGNVTTLSPHNFDLIPEGPSEDMAWSYYSERDGKRINVDMLKAIRLLESITGEKLVHIV